MEKRAIINEENTPAESGCCGGNKCGSSPAEKTSADNLEDSTTTRASQHAQDKIEGK